MNRNFQITLGIAFVLSIVVLILISHNLNTPGETADENSAADILAQAGSTVITVDEMRGQLDFMAPEERDMLRRPEAFRDYVTKRLYFKMVLAEARAAGLETDSEYLNQQQLANERLLLNYYQQYWMDHMITVTDDDIQTYYNENPQEFNLPTRIQVVAWEAPNAESALNAYQELSTGGNAAAVAAKYHFQQLNIPSIWQEDELQDDPLGQFFLNLSDGGFSVRNIQGKVLVLYRVQTAPAKFYSLAEAREEIIKYLKFERAEKAFREHINQIQQANPVSFNENEFPKLDVIDITLAPSPQPPGQLELPGAGESAATP